MGDGGNPPPLTFSNRPLECVESGVMFHFILNMKASCFQTIQLPDDRECSRSIAKMAWVIRSKLC